MAASKDQTSAATLSVWHCILSWFFMNAEDHHLKDPEYIKVMTEVFKDMKTIRSIIHPEKDEESHETVDAIMDIKRVAGQVSSIKNKIPKERWAEEISSMMHEFLAMHQVLKDHGTSLASVKIFSELAPNCKGRHLACILTIWYWLAAWSSKLDKQASENSKQVFLDSVESKYGDLAKQLFTTSSASGKVPDELQDMMVKLLDMLKSNPQHWEGALEHFIETIKEAGTIRGHAKATVDAAKKTLDLANDNAGGSSGLTVHPKLIRPVTGRPLGSLFKNSILKTKLPLTNVVHELREPIGKLIPGLPESAKSISDKAIDAAKDVAMGLGHEIIKGVEKAATTVYEDIKGAAETVHHEVVDLVHGIGEGAHKFVNWFTHIF